MLGEVQDHLLLLRLLHLVEDLIHPVVEDHLPLLFSNNQKLLLQLDVVLLDADLQVEAHLLDRLMHNHLKYLHQSVEAHQAVHLAVVPPLVHQDKQRLLVEVHQVARLVEALLAVHLVVVPLQAHLDRQKLLVEVLQVARLVEDLLVVLLVVVHRQVLLEQKLVVVAHLEVLPVVVHPDLLAVHQEEVLQELHQVPQVEGLQVLQELQLVPLEEEVQLQQVEECQEEVVQVLVEEALLVQLVHSPQSH